MVLWRKLTRVKILRQCSWIPVSCMWLAGDLDICGGSVASTCGCREDRAITRDPGLDWRSGGLEAGPEVPVSTSLLKATHAQSVIPVLSSPKPRPQQPPRGRNEPHCWHSGPIPKLCCASRCHLRPLLEKVVWMWMGPQMVPNLTKI